MRPSDYPTPYELMLKQGVQFSAVDKKAGRLSTLMVGGRGWVGVCWVAGWVLGAGCLACVACLACLTWCTLRRRCAHPANGIPCLMPQPPLCPPSRLQTYAASALIVIAVLNRLPIKLLPGQRGTGRRHSTSTAVQVWAGNAGGCNALGSRAVLRQPCGRVLCVRAGRVATAGHQPLFYLSCLEPSETRALRLL